MRLIPDNPVLTKELRVRMRGSRAYWIQFAYLGLLTLILLFNYASWQSGVGGSGVGSSTVAELGSNLFNYNIITQMFLVLFITPAITSGALTIENEQRTMDMLTMTRLPRHSIIVGKLLSAVSFTALLLISSLPLVSISFMLGSVDPVMVFSYYVMLLMGSFLIAAIGLLWSSIARSTTQAVMYTYASIFVLYIFVASEFGLNSVAAAGFGQFGGLLQSLGASWFGTSFLGLPVVQGVGFGIICLITGLVCCAIASSRLETFPERKAPVLRGLTILLLTVQLLAINTWWLNGWYHRGGSGLMTIVSPPIIMLFYVASFMMLLVPTFTTGELLPREARNFKKYLIWGWTPAGFKLGKMASGIPFMLVLTGYCIALYLFSFVLVGRPGDMFKSLAPANPPPIPSAFNVIPGQNTPSPFSNGSSSAFTATSGPIVPNKPVGGLLQICITLVVSVLGFSMFCVFLSLAFGSRWIAWIISSICLVVGMAGPELSRVPLYAGAQTSFGVNLFYFNPAQAIFQIGDPASYYNNSLLSSNSMLLGAAPMWIGVTLTWGLVGLLSSLAIIPLVRRKARDTKPVPYEEMVSPV